MKKYRYLNNWKMGFSFFINLIMWIVFLFFLITFFGMLFTGEISNNEYSSKDVILLNILLIILTVLFIWGFRKTWNNIMLLTKGWAYMNNVISKDKDGIIKISGRAHIEKIPIDNLSILIQKGYYINCKIDKKGEDIYLVLNNAVYNESIEENQEVKEILLKDLEEYNLIDKYTCPNCGAEIEIKNRDSVICSYCRTKLVFKRDVDKKIK